MASTSPISGRSSVRNQKVLPRAAPASSHRNQQQAESGLAGSRPDWPARRRSRSRPSSKPRKPAGCHPTARARMAGHPPKVIHGGNPIWVCVPYPLESGSSQRARANTADKPSAISTIPRRVDACNRPGRFRRSGRLGVDHEVDPMMRAESRSERADRPDGWTCGGNLPRHAHTGKANQGILRPCP